MQQFIYSQLLWHTSLVDLMYTHSIRLQSILHKQSCVQSLVVLNATISSCSRKDICCYSYSFHTFYVLDYIPTFYVILHRICTAGTPHTSSSCYIVISTETILSYDYATAVNLACSVGTFTHQVLVVDN